MSSPTPTLTMVGLYLSFVLVGPHIMKNRNPVNVRIPMMVYNFLMIFLSYYLFHEVCKCSIYKIIIIFNLKFLFGMIGAGFTFLCDPVDYSNGPSALRVSKSNVFYLIFLIGFAVGSSMLALLCLKIH